jgi:hypothetical protein
MFRNSSHRSRRVAIVALFAMAFAWVSAAHAQVDPVRRDLFEFGYDQHVHGHAPAGAYIYYYLSRPQFGDADHALRVALSPVYVDAEWAVRNVLGPNTDIGVGVSGGGFADDYHEIHNGRWLRDQSFTGHDGGIDVSLYHLFNPGDQLPVNGILRGGVRYVAFERDSENPPTFVLPDSQPMATVRAGLRAGGVEPVLAPDVAAELSIWYEAQFRTDPGTYGFGDDRRVESTVQRFWARGLFIYTFPESGQRIALQAIGGASVHGDRLSAWRIGGVLPLDSEYPLVVPGYYEGELSARNFVLMGADYMLPIDPARQWQLGFGATVARIDFTPGLEEPHAWNSGISAAIGYTPTTKAWKASLVYGHAFDALRNGHRGADSVSLLMELDLERLGYMRADATSAR